MENKSTETASRSFRKLTVTVTRHPFRKEVCLSSSLVKQGKAMLWSPAEYLSNCETPQAGWAGRAPEDEVVKSLAEHLQIAPRPSLLVEGQSRVDASGSPFQEGVRFPCIPTCFLLCSLGN